MPTETPTHTRTAEHTPIPGGGAWAWDVEAGAWFETLPATQNDTPNTPAQE